MESIKDFHRTLNPDQTHLISSMKKRIEADSVSAVSFELFEMLAVRPMFDRLDTGFFMEREFRDVFVGKRTFYDIRCEAEKYVSVRAAKKEKTFTLEEIYQRIEKISGISPSSREKLMKRECALEEFFCFARNTGFELFSLAKKLGRKIIITADTYLPRSIVEKILENCGYKGFDALYVTSEKKAAKLYGGELFSLISSEMNIQPGNILHFGCSYEADAEAPINNGWQAMLIASCRDRLVGSGRLCGYISKKLFYDFASEKYLALRCILGLYAIYAFDCPMSKAIHSDFCEDRYLLGFIVLGPIGCFKDFVADSEMLVRVLAALGKDSDAVKGREDFERLFSAVFRDNMEKYGFDGCDLPLRFLTDHGAVGDRMALDKYFEPVVSAEWGSHVSEPETVPVFTKQRETNFASRLLDKMFPPNTAVRKILDRIMAKIHI